MLKEDRTAIVVSGIYSFFIISTVNYEVPIALPICISPVLFYWGSRFIKGDIDFKKNDQD